MERRVELKGSSASPSLQETHQFLTEVLVTLFPTDNGWIENFSGAFEIHKFDLGDEFDSTVTLEQNQSQQSKLYIICQGRVRLTSVDSIRQQEIAVASLEAGESWGIDAMFYQHPLSYRAIGSTPGLVATLPIAQLHCWFEQVPQLQAYLLRTTQTRQQLIFFKVKTKLRSQPSHVLKSYLCNLEEITIPAGSPLSQVTPNGHFWLRYGQIHSSSSQSLPKVGDDWGYPDSIPSDWVAARDLGVYTIGIPHWDELQPLLSQIRQSQGQIGTADSPTTVPKPFTSKIGV